MLRKGHEIDNNFNNLEEVKSEIPFLKGCWSCYHHNTMSQFGGDPEGRRPRGFYGTYKVHRCGKHYKGVTTFSTCPDHDINGGFEIVSGAGFEGYDKNKVNKRMDFFDSQNLEE